MLPTKDRGADGVEGDGEEKSANRLEERPGHDDRFIRLPHDLSHAGLGELVGVVEKIERENAADEVRDRVDDDRLEGERGKGGAGIVHGLMLG